MIPKTLIRLWSVAPFTKTKSGHAPPEQRPAFLVSKRELYLADAQAAEASGEPEPGFVMQMRKTTNANRLIESDGAGGARWVLGIHPGLHWTRHTAATRLTWGYPDEAIAWALDDPRRGAQENG
jgi:hypothetical protein